VSGTRTFLKFHFYFSFVANSTLSTLTFGDGLFAKRDIPATSLIAIYAGFFIDVNKTLTLNNLTVEEREDLDKNLMSYNETHNLDLPPALTRFIIVLNVLNLSWNPVLTCIFFFSIVTYRATLGHKVCQKSHLKKRHF